MNDTVYTFNGKDITMNVCIQIKAVIKLLQEKFEIGFMEAAMQFYQSKRTRHCKIQKMHCGQNQRNI